MGKEGKEMSFQFLYIFAFWKVLYYKTPLSYMMHPGNVSFECSSFLIKVIEVSTLNGSRFPEWALLSPLLNSLSSNDHDSVIRPQLRQHLLGEVFPRPSGGKNLLFKVTLSFS